MLRLTFSIFFILLSFLLTVYVHDHDEKGTILLDFVFGFAYVEVHIFYFIGIMLTYVPIGLVRFVLDKDIEYINFAFSDIEDIFPMLPVVILLNIGFVLPMLILI